MKRPYFSPLARRDLIGILQYVAKDRPGAATKLVDRLEKACFAVARNPDLGTACEDLSSGLRVRSVGKYAIFYRPAHDGVDDIVRVVRGSRDFPALFLVTAPTSAAGDYRHLEKFLSTFDRGDQ